MNGRSWGTSHALTPVGRRRVSHPPRLAGSLPGKGQNVGALVDNCLVHSITAHPTLGLAACLIAASLLAASPAPSADWPQWRGPERDGRAPGYQAPAAWPDSLRRDWRAEVGEGHAGPVVVGDRVYVHARLDEMETLSCLSLASGEVLWRRTNPVPYEMHPAARGHGKGPKSTPAAADGRVFTLGITGILSSYDAASGELLWRWDSAGRFPATAPLFGTATSPIVVGDLVVAHLGGPGRGALLALAADSGEERWRWDGDGPGYASPLVVDAGGPVLVTQSERSCLALDAATGQELWRRPFTTPFDQNIVTPVLLGPGIVALSGLEQGTLAFRFERGEKGLQVQELWHNGQDWLYMASPVVAGGRLFGLTRKYRGRLFCLDTRTGERLWEGPGELGDNGVFVDVGSALLMLTTEARLAVLSTPAADYTLLAEYRVAESPTWAHPAVAGERILVKDKTHVACWRLPAAEAGEAAP